MNIIAYQIDNGTCRFIYSVSEGSYNVVSVENYGGMIDFLTRSEGMRLSASESIYDYAKRLIVADANYSLSL
jgi:hypothetical protein